MSRVSGLRDLDRRLARLAGGLPPATVRAALAAGGEVIAAEMRRLAPVDTGRLRDSIRVTDAVEGQLYGRFRADEVRAFVGPVGSTEDGDVFYARFLEFGTFKMAAQPFLRPAYAAKREEAAGVVVAALRAAVERGLR